MGACILCVILLTKVACAGIVFEANVACGIVLLINKDFVFEIEAICGLGCVILEVDVTCDEPLIIGCIISKVDALSVRVDLK